MPTQVFRDKVEHILTVMKRKGYFVSYVTILSSMASRGHSRYLPSVHWMAAFK